jgi:hypothetical protein
MFTWRAKGSIKNNSTIVRYFQKVRIEQRCKHHERWTRRDRSGTCVIPDCHLMDGLLHNRFRIRVVALCTAVCACQRSKSRRRWSRTWASATAPAIVLLPKGATSGSSTSWSCFFFIVAMQEAARGCHTPSPGALPPHLLAIFSSDTSQTYL